jgi:hypothetical protein
MIFPSSRAVTSVMRRALPALAVMVAALSLGTALAQPAPPPPPLPDALPPPAPPPPLAGDPELEPQVTIVRREGETHEEVRIGGELRFVRVTPSHGRPYYLVPDPNGQQFIRRNTLDSGLRVPLWVLFSW